MMCLYLYYLRIYVFTYLSPKGSRGYALQIAHGLRFADPVA
jgi:hypothetical protein